MIEIGSYIAFLTAALIIIVVPGPTNLTIVSDSIKAGIRRSIWTVAGAAVSHAGFIAVATAGVGTVLEKYPQIFVFLKWFGVLYLVIQGVSLLVRRRGQATTDGGGSRDRGLLDTSPRGLSLTLQIRRRCCSTPHYFRPL